MKRLLCGHSETLSIRTLFAGLMMLALCCGVAHATNSPVAVPYADSFEGYPSGTALIGTNGWYSANPTGATVVAESVMYPLRTPLEVSSPSQVVQIVDDVTNVLVHAPGADTNVWVDTMILPVRSTVQPDVSNDVQLAVYVNTNGHLVVFHSYYDETTARVPGYWSELDHPPLPSNEWVRLTIKLDYLTGEMYNLIPAGGISTNPLVPPTDQFFPQYVDKFFQVSLNGSAPLTTEKAYEYIPFNLLYAFEPYPYNGSWFLMANSGSGLGSSNINSVTIQGTGLIDDYVVTNGDVFAATPTRWLIEATTDANGTIYPGGDLLIPEGDSVTFTAIPDDGFVADELVVDGSANATDTWTFNTVTTSHTIHATFKVDAGFSPMGVLLSWYDGFGIDPDGAGPMDGEMGDWDSDGALNWEEYVADTIPTDSSSVFTVLDTQPGSFVLTWLAGATNGGATDAFAILRTTDIMDTNSWAVVTNGLPRSADGTNNWTDVNPPAEAPVFYRPAILWP